MALSLCCLDGKSSRLTCNIPIQLISGCNDKAAPKQEYSDEEAPCSVESFSLDAMNESDVETTLAAVNDIESGLSPKQHFHPWPPRQDMQPRAFNQNGCNARELSIRDDELSTHSASITPVMEVSATMVDTEEENRKRQEHVKKEVQQILSLLFHREFRTV